MKNLLTAVFLLITIHFSIYANNEHNEKMLAQSTASFLKNNGQWKSDVLYTTCFPGLNFRIEPDGIYFDKYEASFDSFGNPERLTGIVLKMEFVGGNKILNTYPKYEQKTKYNFINGKDRHSSAAVAYNEVLLADIYDGIDARFYFENGQIRYDLIVNPGSDPSRIKIKFDGADNIAINPQGNLIINTGNGEFEHRDLKSYQMADAKKQFLASCFIRKSALEVGFEVSGYNKNLPLIIDPLIYSIYFGGGINLFPVTDYKSGVDAAKSMAIDDQGNVYVAGLTSVSTDFPTTTGVYSKTYNNGDFDAFVAKIDASGNRVWCTYLGGDSTDVALSIAVDATYNVYVAGMTKSANFPTTAGVWKRTYAGTSMGFISKINPSGTALVFSTYLGATGGSTQCNSITVDGGNKIIVGGLTTSTSFETTPNAAQKTYSGSLLKSEGFVTKLNNVGDALVGSTFLGGLGTDVVYGVKLDALNNVYVTGVTDSTGFPFSGSAYQKTVKGGSDCFVAKLNAALSSIIFATAVGGTGDDIGYAIDIDDTGDAYITGKTTSSNYPVKNAAIGTLGGGYDGFVTKVKADGTDILYSSYLGGKANDFGASIAVNQANEAYIAGTTLSDNFPVTLGALYPKYDGYTIPAQLAVNMAGLQAFGIDVEGGSGFITKMSSDGLTLSYSSYLKNNVSTYYTIPYDLAIDDSGYVYTAGYGIGTDLSQTIRSFDVYATKFALQLTVDTIKNIKICNGKSFNLTFQKHTAFITGNTFTAELSDAKGSFASPVTIGTQSNQTSNTITCTIPPNTVADTSYRIRIKASNPAITSDNNGANITIYDTPKPLINGPFTVCENSTIVYFANDSTNLNSQWQVLSGGTIVGSATNNSVSVQWSNKEPAKLRLTQTNKTTSCDGLLEKDIKIWNPKYAASAEVDFGEIIRDVGTLKSSSFTIKNASANVDTSFIQSITIANNQGTIFKPKASVGDKVLINNTVSFPIDCDITQVPVGPLTGQMYILMGPCGDSIKINLKAQVTEVHTSQPPSPNLGEILLDSSETADINLQNTGSTLIVIDAITVPEPFTVTNTQFPLPATIIPGQSINCTIKGVPNTPGINKVNLTMTTSVPVVTTVTVQCVIFGAQPLVEVANVELGTVIINSSRTDTIKFHNSGNVPVVFNKINYNPIDVSTDFTLPTGSAGITIYPKQTYFLPVTFKPSSLGMKKANLSVEWSYQGKTTLNRADPIEINGYGGGDGNLVFSKNFIDFGTVQVSDSSAEFAYTVTNKGNAAVTISNIAITPSNRKNNVRVINKTELVGSNLEINQTKTIKLKYFPSVADTIKGNIMLISDVGSVPVNYLAIGGGKASFSLTPNLMDEAILGDSSETEITVTNNSTQADRIVRIYASPAAEFRVKNEFVNAQLNVGKFVRDTVIFKPSAGGKRNGNIIIETASSGTFSNNAVNGNSIDPAGKTIIVKSINYGKVPLTTNKVLNMTIRNVSKNGVIINSVSINQEISGEFKQDNLFNNVTLTAGQISSFSTTFEPKKQGDRKATIDVFYSGTTESGNLAGYGSPLYVTTADFGIVRKNGKSLSTALVINNGADPDTLVSAAITSSNSGAFYLNSNLDINTSKLILRSHDTLAIPIYCNPNVEDSLKGTIQVISRKDDASAKLLAKSRTLFPDDMAGTLSIYANPGEAAPNEMVVLTGSIKQIQNLYHHGNQSFEAWVRFDKNILYPYVNLTNQNASSNVTDYLRRVFITGVWRGDDSTVFTLPCSVMLADTDVTSIVVEKFTWKDSWNKTLVEIADNQDFKVKICTVGGKRLIYVPGRKTSGSAIIMVKPSPVSSEAVIEYLTNEKGVAEIYLIDIFGNKVCTLVNETVEAGSHSSPLIMGDIPDGTYNLILCIGTESSSRKVQVIK
ncbi:MAG: choice-of-anchor D domain-containing protein [Candidatus Kapabacteria bacterium]|nr:choice-of-anchor D domain-containing protein [Candidatus Kapabacteria bacterium]